MALRILQLGSVSSCTPHVVWYRDFRAMFRSSTKPLWHLMAHFPPPPTDLPSILLFLKKLSRCHLMGKGPGFSCNSLPYQLPPSYCAYVRKFKKFQDDLYDLILNVMWPLLSIFCQRKQPCCSPDFWGVQGPTTTCSDLTF